MIGAVPALVAAPADLMASVMSPSRMFPGLGFMSKPLPQACAWASYWAMSLAKRWASSGVTQRRQRSCSAPQSSGNSLRTLAPPEAHSKSERRPTTGLALMPEKPSLPPHFTPMVRSEMGQGSRSNRFASATPAKVARIAFWSMSLSECAFCCSKMASGLSKRGFCSAISRSRTLIWACWHPRLKIVAPATLGLFK